jgi:DnaK suppressor protein
MDERTLADFKELLDARLRGLLSGRYGPVSNIEHSGRAEPMDLADMATLHSDMDLINTMRSRNQKLVNEIRSAIRRIEKGEFGICWLCSDSIGLERLQAQPAATLCIRCQGRMETLKKRRRHAAYL